MEDGEELLAFFGELSVSFYPFTVAAALGILILVILLFCSALISGSEVAYFSLSPSDFENLSKKKSRAGVRVLKLHDKPEHLLATILIANNFVNVAIVILSTVIVNSLVDFTDAPVIGFLIQAVAITFMLLLFGEILPKLYANEYPLAFSKLMSLPLTVLEKVFRPVGRLLVASTDKAYSKLSAAKKENISITDLSHALDLTSSSLSENKDMLKGIVDFGNKYVTEVMKPRIDVEAIDTSLKMDEVVDRVIESGYSRIPVFEETFDNVKGLLYVKDLLPHHHKGKEFNWQTLVRPPYFVPETKRINDLLKEFQVNKIHLAVVVDEYGGTTGIVTMEDILEEIVGEISDEFDYEEELYFSKLDDRNYIFEGKTPLNDFYKILDLKGDEFEEVRGDADTLAGFILELKGEIPEKNEKITFKNFEFRIESSDSRRIKQIKVRIDPQSGSQDEQI